MAKSAFASLFILLTGLASIGTLYNVTHALHSRKFTADTVVPPTQTVRLITIKPGVCAPADNPLVQRWQHEQPNGSVELLGQLMANSVLRPCSPVSPRPRYSIRQRILTTTTTHSTDYYSTFSSTTAATTILWTTVDSDSIVTKQNTPATSTTETLNRSTISSTTNTTCYEDHARKLSDDSAKDDYEDETQSELVIATEFTNNDEFPQVSTSRKNSSYGAVASIGSRSQFLAFCTVLTAVSVTSVISLLYCSMRRTKGAIAPGRSSKAFFV